MKRPFIACSVSLLLMGMMILSGCATIKVGTISVPTPDTKLRVYVLAFSQKGPNWTVHHDTFVEQAVGWLIQHLRGTGIFTIVSSEDVNAVLDGQDVDRSQLLADNSAAARQVGKALYADYIILVERKIELTPLKKELVFAIDLIKTDTGRKHSIKRSSSDLLLSDKDLAARSEVFTLMYRELFRETQKELMAAAARKADLASGSASASSHEQALAAPSLPDHSARVEAAIMKAEIPASGSAFSGPQKVVVFDFEAPEQYRTIAHILTESFREELLLLNQFVLVNRENLQQVLQEQSLQQTGLIDERQAVKTGKGLAAKQVVTGGVGIIGNTFVLQIKLIDVETYATLNLVSATFPRGNEDEILGKMPELARKLANRQ